MIKDVLEFYFLVFRLNVDVVGLFDNEEPEHAKKRHGNREDRNQFDPACLAGSEAAHQARENDVEHSHQQHRNNTAVSGE